MHDVVARLEAWARPIRGVELLRSANVTAAELESIEASVRERVARTPVVLDAATRAAVAAFRFPPSYRRFVETFGTMELRARGRPWKPLAMLDVERLRRHSALNVFELADPTGESRACHTASYVAFAHGPFEPDAGCTCFLLGRAREDGELPVLVVENDFEALWGQHVDDGTWVDPASRETLHPDFATWLARITDAVTSLDVEDADALVDKGEALLSMTLVTDPRLTRR